MNDAIVKPRRWFRFSLRALFVVVTLLCVWLGFKVNAARRQKEALAAIHKAHGGVFFDYEMAAMPGSPDRLIPSSAVAIVNRVNSRTLSSAAPKPTFPPAAPNLTPPGPEWLRKFLGDEYFREVFQVSMGGPQYDYIDESEFARLSALSEVRNLFLTNMKIATGPHMERPLRDSDLAVLAKMRQLQDLYIEGEGITGSGFASLVGLSELKILRMEGNRFDDAGMKYIGSLTSLEQLIFNTPLVTDDGLAQLQNLKNLNLLFLTGANISDAGLHFLKRLPKLKNLDLRQTRVTPEGVRELRNSLPNTTITGPA